MLRSFHKYIFIFVLIAFFVISFNSCTSGSETKKPSWSEAATTAPGLPKVKLRFISSWGGVDSKSDTLQQVLDKFMEDHPGVEVVNESMFGDDFLPKIKTDFASGNDPDVFGLWPGSDIRALVKAGRVAELTDYIRKDRAWEQSVAKSAWAYTEFDGKRYGVPFEIIFEGLFINQDLFKRYNVKIPKTYKELKQAISKFKENDIIPIAYNSMAEGSYLYQNIIAMLGGKKEVEQPFTGGKINRCYVDAMRYIKELYDMKAFPSNFVKLNSIERNNLFKTKKAAMIVQGSWFIGELRDQDDTVNIIPFPAIDEDHSSAMIYGLGNGAFYMSTVASVDKDKREYSLKLIKALTSKKSAVLFANQTGMLSAVDISDSNVNYGRLVKRGQELLNNSRLLVGPPDSFVDRSFWEEDVVKEFPYYLDGRVSAESIWEKVAAGSLAGNE